MTQVKAAVLLEPNKLEIQKFPYPSVTNGSMIIKIKYCGICGTDKHIYSGKVPWKLKYPFIPGHEIVGEVCEIGNDAKDMVVNSKELDIGNLVTVVPGVRCGKCWFCRHLPHRAAALCENVRLVYGLTSCTEPPHLFGGWSEFIYIIPGSWVYKVPPTLSPEIAVLVEPLAATNGIDRALSLHSFTKEGFGPMDTIVIQGSGPIGILAAFRAKVYGAGKVIMIGAPDFRLKLAEKFGVDYTINIENFKLEDRIKEVYKLTESRGADVVVECAGTPDAFKESLKLVRRGGTIVELGHFTSVGTTDFDPWWIVYKDVTIIGQMGYPPTQFGKDLTLLSKYIDVFPFKELISHKFKLEEIKEGLHLLTQFKTIKAIVEPH
ncbi:MAG: zinc-binding dehydrogenase [Candidatus Methanomethylicaceae archaeon]